MITNQAKMNVAEDNTTKLSCGFEFYPLDPTKFSPYAYAAYDFKIAINVFTCPFTILLNILVMVAVKTKRQLRTKSNIALACLATTDLMVGLALQPVTIALFTLIRLQGNEARNTACTLTDATIAVSIPCILASLYHLLLISGERYLAIKHSFAYDTGLVSEVRIIIASGVAWFAATIILPVDFISEANKQFMSAITVFVIFVFIPVMIYFNVSIYQEVRRNEKHIIANQVSVEAKAKLLKNKKSFYTTAIVLLTIILCYIPFNVSLAILAAFKDEIPATEAHIVFSVTSSLVALNSLFNPLIYAVRIRHFRVAFIELLSRKTLAQAEELENRIFGSRQIGIVAGAEQEQHRSSREENVQQANETLNNEHATTAGAQSQVEHLEEIAL